MRSNLLALVASLSMTTTLCLAHDQYADGTPVPVWIRQACCGVSDYHRLDDTQVRVTAQGYLLEGYNEGPVPMSQALPSQDSYYHAFWAEIGGGRQSPIYCLFVPPGGV